MKIFPSFMVLQENILKILHTSPPSNSNGAPLDNFTVVIVINATSVMTNILTRTDNDNDFNYTMTVVIKQKIKEVICVQH